MIATPITTSICVIKYECKYTGHLIGDGRIMVLSSVPERSVASSFDKVCYLVAMLFCTMGSSLCLVALQDLSQCAMVW